MGQCFRIKSCILWLNFREIDFYLWLCFRICFSCDLSHHAGRLDTISLILFNQNPRETRDLCPRFCRMFLNNRSLNSLVVRRLHHCRRMRYLNGILRGSCSIYCSVFSNVYSLSSSNICRWANSGEILVVQNISFHLFYIVKEVIISEYIGIWKKT